MAWKCSRCGNKSEPNPKGVYNFVLLHECHKCCQHKPLDKTISKLLLFEPPEHLHVIGQYDHSCSEYYNFRIGSECDGLNMHHEYYKHCPECGDEITKEIVEKQEKM